MRVIDPYTPLRDIHDRYEEKRRGKSKEYELYFGNKRIVNGRIQFEKAMKSLRELRRIENL